jgi:hypothetical protein
MGLMPTYSSTLIPSSAGSCGNGATRQRSALRGPCQTSFILGVQDGYAHPGSIQPPFTLVFQPGDHISQNIDNISIQFHRFTSENHDTI